MNCKNAHKKMHENLAGKLPHAELAGLKQHLSTCPDCSLEADRLSQAWGLLLELPASRQAPDLLPGVMYRISQIGEETFTGSVISWIAGLKTSFAAATVCAMLTGFICGFSALEFLSAELQSPDPEADTVYFEVFSDIPPASISNACMSLIHEKGDENL